VGYSAVLQAQSTDAPEHGMSEKHDPRPHDGLFKYTFRQKEQAVALLKQALPAELSRVIEWDTLKLENTESAERHIGPNDLAFSIVIRGIASHLFVTFEHQSTSEKFMGRRFFLYMAGRWADFHREHPDKPLPPVVPVLLHHSDQGWQGSLEFLADVDLSEELRPLLEPYLPNFRFVLEDISHRTDDEFRKMALPALALASCLALARARKAKTIEELRGLQEEALLDVRRASNGVAALNRVVRYIAQVSNLEVDELALYVQDTFGEEVHEVVMATAEKIRSTSRQERALELVLKQLTVKFGPLSDEVIKRLESAADEHLDRIAERLITASAVEEVFDES
jgi:hypothetical protein